MKKKDKNYTLYLIAGISAVLTVPIATLILNSVQMGLFNKTVMIMVVFIILLISILLLYKMIFKVSVQEIAQEDKVTELDRLSFALSEQRKRHYNQQVRRCIDIVMEQVQRFKRRKEVLLQITGAQDGGAVDNLVENVEEVLQSNVRRLLNRVEIFDDQGIPEVIKQNLGYMEGLLFKNNEIMTEFETLITEASQMGDTDENQDISKLKDVINAMQSLRNNSDDEIDELAKKYSK